MYSFHQLSNFYRPTDMEKESMRNETVEEPQISSPDPEERILARRLRIQKRNAATKKR